MSNSNWEQKKDIDLSQNKPAIFDKNDQNPHVKTEANVISTIDDQEKNDQELNENSFGKFGNLHKGLIATGDMFISNKKKINQLSKEISHLSAVEMEGAAFAQVAFQENIPWCIIRVISDQADEDAADVDIF